MVICSASSVLRYSTELIADAVSMISSAEIERHASSRIRMETERVFFSRIVFSMPDGSGFCQTLTDRKERLTLAGTIQNIAVLITTLSKQSKKDRISVPSSMDGKSGSPFVW